MIVFISNYCGVVVNGSAPRRADWKMRARAFFPSTGTLPIDGPDDRADRRPGASSKRLKIDFVRGLKQG